jgi:hypothetical protein
VTDIARRAPRLSARRLLGVAAAFNFAILLVLLLGRSQPRNRCAFHA